MQVHVKTPHTDIRIQGEIPPSILEALRNEYGNALELQDINEEVFEIRDTDWFQHLQVKPGEVLRIYRENAGMSQAQLGARLGGIPRQAVSGMERGRRAISLSTAKKLAAIFQVPASRFLDVL